MKKNIIAPYIDFELMDMLQKKEEFYKLCEKHGVDYPKTLIYEREMGRNLDVEFEFPVILKPSDSIMYWEYRRRIGCTSIRRRTPLPLRQARRPLLRRQSKSV